MGCYNLQVFTPLYRAVKETLLIASTSKESLRSLIIHQWSVTWCGNCPKRE